MQKDIFQGKWNEVKGKLKERWGKLTDDEIKQIQGKREQLIGKLQAHYGYAKDRAEQEVKQFESTFLKSSCGHSEACECEEKTTWSAREPKEQGSRSEKNTKSHLNPQQRPNERGNLDKGNPNQERPRKF